MIVRLSNRDTGRQVVRDTEEYRLVLDAGSRDADMILTFPDEDGDKHYEINKELHELYIMNDQGETIDSYRWKNTQKLAGARDKQ